MNETIEFDMTVGTVTVAKGEDRVITIPLKGEKAIVVNPTPEAVGFELIDILEIKMTIKCSMPDTARQLGIEKYMNQKVIVLRDRDMQLQSFGDQTPVETKRDGVLAKYEGIVPDAVLRKVESAVPDELLQSLE